jgi:hypothetical protein
MATKNTETNQQNFELNETTTKKDITKIEKLETLLKTKETKNK